MMECRPKVGHLTLNQVIGVRIPALQFLMLPPFPFPFHPVSLFLAHLHPILSTF